MSGSFSEQEKIIDECEAWTAAGFLQIKTNTIARRFTYDISLWNELYQVYGREKKLFGCWPSLSCQDCLECEFSWNKIGRITIIRNNGANKHKLNVGWRSDKNNYSQLKLSAFFHEVLGDKDDYPYYWVSHYIKNVHTDTKHYIDMYLSLGNISLIVDYDAVVIRKPGMIPDTKKSYLMRTFYCGDDLLTKVKNCVPTESMKIKYENQKYDKSGFPDRLNTCKYITVNISEFESGDIHTFYAYEDMYGSISDTKAKTDVQYEAGHPNPIKQKCVVSSGADITFSAGNKIILSHGFHAKPGSHFKAEIIKKKKYPGYYDEPKRLNLPPLDQSEPCGKLPDSMNFARNVNNLEYNEFDEFSDNQESFQIYPNPSPGLFTLHFNDGENTAFAVKITNMMGNVVYRRENVQTGSTAIDIREKPKGIYFVKVLAGGEVFTEKVVVE